MDAAPLDDLLRRVARSFYLSLRVLPEPVREPIAVGYLLARAADSIADTELVAPPERRDLLQALREAVLGTGDPVGLELRLGHLSQTGGPGADERQLLSQLSTCLAWLARLPTADRERVQRVLGTLLTGMERDLARFPAATAAVAPEQVMALQSLADLDEYTYFAAGCVGEFWSELCAARLPGLTQLRRPDLLRRGVALGKALQLVNVIRDAPADLRTGRCYWPEELLAPVGLSPRELAELVRPGAPPPTPFQREAVLQVTTRLCRQAMALAEEAWPYVQAIPPSMLRLRLACAWPLLLGLGTLRLVQAEGSPLLRPDQVLKVSRREVRAVVLRSAAAAFLDRLRGQAEGGLLDRLRERYASS